MKFAPPNPPSTLTHSPPPPQPQPQKKQKHKQIIRTQSTNTKLDFNWAYS